MVRIDFTIMVLYASDNRYNYLVRLWFGVLLVLGYETALVLGVNVHLGVWC